MLETDGCCAVDGETDGTAVGAGVATVVGFLVGDSEGMLEIDGCCDVVGTLERDGCCEMEGTLETDGFCDIDGETDGAAEG